MTNALDVADSDAVGEVKNFGVKVINACAAKFFKRSIGGLTIYENNKGDNWNLGSSVCVDFVNHIQKKFDRTGKIFGVVDKGSLSAIENYRSYYVDSDFTSFVNCVMASLCKEANEPNRTAISEGYVVFAHYKENAGNDKLLVVMLGKMSGYNFDNDENLTPKDSESLNLKDFRQAASMDLTLFSRELPSAEAESYLHFIKGHSKSDFFNIALGCSDSFSAKVCVDNLKTALDAYLQEEAAGLGLDVKRKIRVKVYDYVESKAGKTVTLSDIQNVVNKCLPDDSPLNGKFKDYIHNNSERFKVSEEFQPSSQTAKKMAYLPVKLANGDFDGQVKFSSITVGDEADTDVSVDEDFVYLRIKLPASIAKQIKDWHTAPE